MKVSAFLAVSLPLVAMSQAPAFAEDAMAETGSWLKQSIATLKAPAAKPAAKRVSHAMPAASQQPVMKLRPFVPNRFLPHERDMQAKMVAQRAQMDTTAYSMDPGTSGALRGEVSYSGQRYPSAYDQYRTSTPTFNAESTKRILAQAAKKALGNRAPRLMPGQSPIIPDQLALVRSSVQPFLPEPPSQRVPARSTLAGAPMQNSLQAQQMVNLQQMHVQQMQLEQTQMLQEMQQMQAMQSGQSMQPQMQAAPNAPLMYQSQPSAQEQMALDRLVAMNRPTATVDFNGDIHGYTQDNPATGTGPEPFPMNLLPGNAMQALSRSHRPANVPQARFGSWHGGRALPECGFHTYIKHRPTQFFEYRVTQATHTQTARKAAPPRKSTRPLSASINPTPARAAAAPKAKPIVVAQYPTYMNSRGLTY